MNFLIQQVGRWGVGGWVGGWFGGWLGWWVGGLVDGWVGVWVGGWGQTKIKDHLSPAKLELGLSLAILSM